MKIGWIVRRLREQVPFRRGFRCFESDYIAAICTHDCGRWKTYKNGEENLRSAKLALNIFCKEKRASKDDMWKSLRRNEEM